MSTATEQQVLAESFVHRAMTADRDKLKALFVEALGCAAALTQENQRFRKERDDMQLVIDGLYAKRNDYFRKLTTAHAALESAKSLLQLANRYFGCEAAIAQIEAVLKEGKP